MALCLPKSLWQYIRSSETFGIFVAKLDSALSPPPENSQRLGDDWVSGSTACKKPGPEQDSCNPDQSWQGWLIAQTRLHPAVPDNINEGSGKRQSRQCTYLPFSPASKIHNLLQECRGRKQARRRSAADPSRGTADPWQSMQHEG